MVAVNDDRPLVKDLLEQHASALAELRAVIEKEDTYSEEHYDDLWMLRFLLTHKKVPKASAAAINTMKFCRERGMNELGRRLEQAGGSHGTSIGPLLQYWQKILGLLQVGNCFHACSARSRSWARSNNVSRRIDMAGIVEKMSQEEVLESYLMSNEIMYQILDEVTRRTGKLTKLLRIMDMTDFSVASFNKEYLRRDAAANKEMEDFYPQLLGTVTFSVMASWATIIFRVFQSVVSQKICREGGPRETRQNSKDSKYFLRYVSKDNLWERYGGKNSDWPVAPPVHLWKN